MFLGQQIFFKFCIKFQTWRVIGTSEEPLQPQCHVNQLQCASFKGSRRGRHFYVMPLAERLANSASEAHHRGGRFRHWGVSKFNTRSNEIHKRNSQHRSWWVGGAGRAGGASFHQEGLPKVHDFSHWKVRKYQHSFKLIIVTLNNHILTHSIESLRETDTKYKLYRCIYTIYKLGS